MVASLEDACHVRAVETRELSLQTWPDFERLFSRGSGNGLTSVAMD
jgi:hypothetical protein